MCAEKSIRTARFREHQTESPLSTLSNIPPSLLMGRLGEAPACGRTPDEFSDATFPELSATDPRMTCPGMKKTIILLGTALISTTLMATETPDCKVIARDGKFEIRDYPALATVRTASGDGGFMRLFRYISGDNEGGRKIPMTAPVLMRNEGDKAGMSFIMPAAIATGAAPSPTDRAVMLDNFGPGRFAVMRFSGGRNAANETKSLAALRGWLESRQLETEGAPVFAYYDPPWIPGFLRRNEVMLQVTGSRP